LLVDSELPFGPWPVAATWLALFAINFRIARRARALNDALTFVSIGDRTALRRGMQPKYVAGQVVFAALVLAIAIVAGGAPFVFLAGGLITAIAWAVGANLQSLLSARAMSQPGQVSGDVTLSMSYSYRQLAYRCGTGAFVCLLLGMLLAHLALIGGAFMLGMACLGYLRRARRAQAKG
jgi:hypothetical protein